MQKAEAQHKYAQPAVRQGKGASLESPQGERIAQLEGMVESSTQAGKLAQLAVMIDASPAMAAQRKLIGQVHGSPALMAQRKAVNGIAQRAETPAKPNNTGLPDNLKSGIESLSGMSMDNVKVHYNSSQPAQLNALAYAQGTDIHVSPGQEQHLPHEAWHVVQQAQGRVKPTMQMKDGVPVNDDDGLEREADVMGVKASAVGGFGVVPGMKDGNNSYQARFNSLASIQRAKKIYQDKTSDDAMAGIIAVLEKCVDFAKEVVDSNPTLQGVPGSGDGYLKAWTKSFNAFMTSKEVPNFFFARYGYAIETIATSQFLTKSLGDYKVMTQVSHGGTRPDFVISLNDKEVAWLDITSKASEGHIFDKQGGGWKTRPFVAEVFYDMPHPSKFAETAKDSLSEEQLEALKKADTQRALKEFEFDIGMKKMGLILGNAFAVAHEKKGDGLSKTDVKDVTKTTCETYLGKLVEGGITASLANGVLGSIESIDVAGAISTGLSWANWAYGGGGSLANARALLWNFGKQK